MFPLFFIIFIVKYKYKNICLICGITKMTHFVPSSSFPEGASSRSELSSPIYTWGGQRKKKRFSAMHSAMQRCTVSDLGIQGNVDVDICADTQLLIAVTWEGSS